MLPCQNDCPVFTDGCHKSCPKWAARRLLQTEENRKKRDFLRIHNALSAELLRQYRELSPLRKR